MHQLNRSLPFQKRQSGWFVSRLAGHIAPTPVRLQSPIPCLKPDRALLVKYRVHRNDTPVQSAPLGFRFRAGLLLRSKRCEEYLYQWFLGAIGRHLYVSSSVPKRPHLPCKSKFLQSVLADRFVDFLFQDLPLDAH